MCVQLCLTLHDPMDSSPPGTSVHGIFQRLILDQVAISYSRESSQSWDQTCISCVSCIGRQILYHCTTWEAPYDLCWYKTTTMHERPTSLLPELCCCCSVARLCPTLCNPMDDSTPGSRALHHLPELGQTHVH